MAKVADAYQTDFRLPFGNFLQSGLGMVESAHKHLIFLSILSWAHDVFGTLVQSESSLHSCVSTTMIENKRNLSQICWFQASEKILGLI